MQCKLQVWWTYAIYLFRVKMKDDIINNIGIIDEILHIRRRYMP